ncbi:MAG: hypothetical protein FKY71_08645 [Spiribacter salinus]|uniref:Glycine-rich domain-containing protein n=1 Tax=Spiribacter salinus TaxID=1335746 RepID=A0A540VRN3_9GAMM|nr:MAG: hypothetical protein FKY71_08645 [Spiribacter salinus]
MPITISGGTDPDLTVPLVREQAPITVSMTSGGTVTITALPPAAVGPVFRFAVMASVSVQAIGAAVQARAFDIGAQAAVQFVAAVVQARSAQAQASADMESVGAQVEARRGEIAAGAAAQAIGATITSRAAQASSTAELQPVGGTVQARGAAITVAAEANFVGEAVSGASYLTASDVTFVSGSPTNTLDYSDADGDWTDLEVMSLVEVSVPDGIFKRVMWQGSGGSGGYLANSSNFAVGAASAGENREEFDFEVTSGTYTMSPGAGGSPPSNGGGISGAETTGFGVSASRGIGGADEDENGRNGYHGSGAGTFNLPGGIGSSGRDGGASSGPDTGSSGGGTGGGAGQGAAGQTAPSSNVGGDGGAGVTRKRGGVDTDYAAGGGGTRRSGDGGQPGAAGGPSATAGDSTGDATPGRGGGTGGSTAATQNGKGGDGSIILTVRRVA